MKVALTGATGFIGARLAASLVADGCEVRALVHPSVDPAPLLGRDVAAVRGDVRDAAAVGRALAGAEVVYHLAAAVPGAARTRGEYRAVNVGGTENVVRAAVSGGVRHIVHCSTVAVHGSPRHLPADERAPFAPMNAYQATKLAAEGVVQRAVDVHGLSAVIARLTSLYGPGDRRSATLYRDVARGRVVVIGRGDSRCHPTYVDDAVAGLRRCGAHAPARGATYIIGGDEQPTIGELVQLIAAAVGVAPRMIHLPAVPFAAAAALHRVLLGRFAPVPGLMDRLDFFLAGHTYDVAKARRELGFSAQVPLHEGVRRTVASYREMNVIR